MNKQIIYKFVAYKGNELTDHSFVDSYFVTEEWYKKNENCLQHYEDLYLHFVQEMYGIKVSVRFIVEELPF